MTVQTVWIDRSICPECYADPALERARDILAGRRYYHFHLLYSKFRQAYLLIILRKPVAEIESRNQICPFFFHQSNTLFIDIRAMLYRIYSCEHSLFYA